MAEKDQSKKATDQKITREDLAAQIREKLGRVDPKELNPELVRLNMVHEAMNEKNKALTEVTQQERRAIAQIRALDQAFKFKDRKTGETRGGLPMTMTFCNEYMDLGACLDRKREDAVVAMLRPKSGYNYKLGYDEEEPPKGIVAKIMDFITGAGKKDESSRR